MPSFLYRYFTPGGSRSGSELEPLTRFAKILTCGVALAAGMYFAFLYLVAGR
jgi:hypothetical protein